MTTHIHIQELAELVQGELIQGDPNEVITGLNSLAEALPGEVSFFGNARYHAALQSTRASALLVDPEFKEARPGIALIRVANPTFAFSHIIQHFRPAVRTRNWGVHPSAVIAPTAQFNAEKVYIGPGVVIEDEVRLGDGCLIHSGVCLGYGATLGNDCTLHANSNVKDRCVLGHRVIIHAGAVIGSDGFGYEFTQGRHVKIDQVGIVQLDDDVEVGSCTTIDRARFGRTWIGEGTKIDNLVQIAHNVVIGKHCIIVAQVGISGSTKIGDHVTLAGQVGIAGHLEISRQVTLLAKSGVTKSITEPGAYTGFPAKPLMEGRRLLAAPAKIPEMLERLKALEKRLAELEGKQGGTSVP